MMACIRLTSPLTAVNSGQNIFKNQLFEGVWEQPKAGRNWREYGPWKKGRIWSERPLACLLKVTPESLQCSTGWSGLGRALGQKEANIQGLGIRGPGFRATEVERGNLRKGATEGELQTWCTNSFWILGWLLNCTFTGQDSKESREKQNVNGNVNSCSMLKNKSLEVKSHKVRRAWGTKISIGIKVGPGDGSVAWKI